MNKCIVSGIEFGNKLWNIYLFVFLNKIYFCYIFSLFSEVKYEFSWEKEKVFRFLLKGECERFS